METKQLEKDANEVLDLLEKHFISYTKDVFKNTANYEMTDKEAEVVLAKLGKRFLLKVLNNS